MSKKFYKDTLKSIPYQQLKELATTWKIKKPSPNKDKLEIQLYNHQNNQITKKISNKDGICEERIKALCTMEQCTKHPQPIININIKDQHKKSWPTKFLRAPLPVCWFVAGCSYFLS